MARSEDAPKAFWRGSRGVRKAELVSRHLSAAFVDQHYEVVRRLNVGSFSQVNLVRERASDELRVCKVIDLKGMDPHVLGMMRKEVQILSALDHPNIVRLYEFAEDEKRQELVLILEYVPGGDCIDLMEERGRLLPETLAARIIQQLLVVLNYCHGRGITHRDVKPENVMLSSLTDEANCKVIDFGLATPYKGRVKEFAGTVSYLAPELAIAQAGFSMAADMWAVGVTAFELLAGVSPFGKLQEYGNECEPILEKLCAYESFDEDLSDVFRQSPGHQQLWRSSEAKDFLRYLLAAEPEDRPTAAQALEHPWLARRRAPAPEVGSDMFKGFAGFAEAPEMHRSCLYALAAKGWHGELDVETVGATFAELDRDNDGKISLEDLRGMLQAGRWWLWRREPEVDVEAFFRAADQEGAGYLSYTDFLAACLFQVNSTFDADLVDEVFTALDHDRNHLLKADEVKHIFRRYPRGLPKYCAFRRDEWRDCLFREVEDEQARSSSGSSEAPRESVVQQWMNSLFCRISGDCDGLETAGDETPPHFHKKVEELKQTEACRLPQTVPAFDMVLTARANAPADPTPVGVSAAQAGRNPVLLQPPKGLLTVSAAGASLSTASTFASLSSTQTTGLHGMTLTRKV
mmetsp:Transcript_798/g.2204  ORF Transcript_798/g.2204 Transcript_798/m.2204 type:complete len:632 (-) Transcript_798:196-2091(-)